MSTDWEAHYQANDTPWDKGEPSPGLVDWLAARTTENRTVSPEATLRERCTVGGGAKPWSVSRWNSPSA